MNNSNQNSLAPSHGRPSPNEEDRFEQNGVTSQPGEASSRLWRIERYLVFLRKKWWILALSALLFWGLGAAYNRWCAVSYVSTARMWMPGGFKLAESAIYEDRSQAQDLGATQVELLESEMIRGRAFAALRAAGVPIPTNAQGDPLPAKLRVTQIARTSVVEITARGPSASYVRAFLNATMDGLLAYMSEIHSDQAAVTYASLNSQITRKDAELKDAQDKLTAYMRTNNVPVLEDRAKAANSYLSELLTEHSKLNLEYDLLQGAVAGGQWAPSFNGKTGEETTELKGAGTGEAAAGSPRAAHQQAQRELEKMKLTRASFSNYFRPEHPKMVKLDQEISRTEALCESLLRENHEQLVSSMKTVKLKMDAIEQSIKEWEAKVNDASERIAEFERVKIDVERMRSFYDHLVVLLQNVKVSRDLPQESISILDRASSATATKLPAYLVLALAVALGLFAGLGLVRLVELLSDKVTSVDYLAYHFGERVVGHIPEAPRGRKQRGLPPVEMDDDRCLFAESYRSVRSALLFGINSAASPRVILVTSAVPKEGKSTVAANLARTLAFGGCRVLLIDGDMRRGMLHEIFQLPPEPGLAELLASNGELDCFVRPTAVKDLFVLPCGRASGSTGELLLRPAFDDLLRHARQTYNYIIVDSIPILAADDSTTMAPKTDGVIFVMRNSFTGTSAAERALRTLYERRVMILGIVFNRAKGARSSTYFNYPEYYSPARPSMLKSETAASLDA